MATYFATSFNNIHVEDEYTKKIHDMAWNML